MLVNSDPPLSGSSPSILRARFERLIHDLESIDAEEARHDASGGQERMPVVRTLLEKLDEAIELHRDTLNSYDNANPETQSDAAGRQKLADLAFMAIAELRQTQERIEQTPDRIQPAAAASIVDDSVRRVRTSLSSVMGRLCDLEGFERPHHFAAELAASLLIRKAYARLRRTITDSRPALDGRIRASKIELAVVRGRPFFSKLSVDDREAIIRLHQRTIAWLALPESAEKGLEGERLWTDLCGVGNELGKVHQRQELVQHDRELLRDVQESLTETKALSPAMMDQLHDLEGISPDLDALLAQRTPDPGALLLVTQELRETRYCDTLPPSPNDISGSWSNSWIQ